MIPVLRVTGNYFPMLGVSAAFGAGTCLPEIQRFILKTPPSRALGCRAGAASSQHKWNVVGATVVLDGVPHVVVGVLPPEFTGTYAPMVPQIYRPIVERGGRLSFDYRLQLLGRLKPAVSIDQGRADLTRIASQLTSDDGQRRVIEVNAARSVVPFITARPARGVGAVWPHRRRRPSAHVQQHRHSHHHPVGGAKPRDCRTACVGCRRSRIVVQLVLETALVCAAAGIVGTYIALETARFATQFYAPVPMPFALTFKLDWRVVVFAGLASGFAVFACGLVPALKVMKTDLTNALKQKTVPAGVQATLAVTQMALTTMLLVSAAVLANGAARSANERRGFQSRGVTMSTIALDRSEYPRDRRLALMEALRSASRSRRAWRPLWWSRMCLRRTMRR